MTDETTHVASPEPGSPSGGNRVSRDDSTAVAHRASGQHRFLNACVLVAILFLTGQWCWISLKRPEPLPWHHGKSFTEFFRVDINQSTWVEWIQLKGIGETMAHRIVADREFSGPFESIDDLLRVNGIGPATLNEIRPWLTINPDSSNEHPSSDNEPSRSQSDAL